MLIGHPLKIFVETAEIDDEDAWVAPAAVWEMGRRVWESGGETSQGMSHTPVGQCMAMYGNVRQCKAM